VKLLGLSATTTTQRKPKWSE